MARTFRKEKPGRRKYKTEEKSHRKRTNRNVRHHVSMALQVANFDDPMLKYSPKTEGHETW